MKNKPFLIALLLGSFLWAACPSTSSNNTVENKTGTTEKSVNTPPSVADDSAAIAETIHAFYKWYNAGVNNKTRLGISSFLDNKGKHLKLNREAMKTYFNQVLQTGTVSNEFVEDEMRFYIACEKLWQNEPKDEVNSGLDADKYWCAQDSEPAEFTTAPVGITVSGDRAKAKLIFDKGSANGESRDFELKKENGKWLLTKIVCDMGVKY